MHELQTWEGHGLQIVRLCNPALSSRPDLQITDAKSVHGLVAEGMSQYDRQVCVVLVLDAANKVLGVQTVATGFKDLSGIPAGDIFRIPVLLGGDSIILAYRDATDGSAPRADTLETIQQLVCSGQILGITILDCLIVSDTEFLSLNESGLLNPASDVSGHRLPKQ